MEVRFCRASAVFVQRVGAGDADWYLDWQRGVNAAAERFAGYRGTDVYPPAPGSDGDSVVVIHFEDEKALGSG
jgi:antibiotic biosynthesis monooxygenase (ABM) superfamily enzyme